MTVCPECEASRVLGGYSRRRVRLLGDEQWGEAAYAPAVEMSRVEVDGRSIGSRSGRAGQVTDAAVFAIEADIAAAVIGCEQRLMERMAIMHMMRARARSGSRPGCDMHCMRAKRHRHGSETLQSQPQHHEKRECAAHEAKYSA